MRLSGASALITIAAGADQRGKGSDGAQTLRDWYSGNNGEGYPRTPRPVLSNKWRMGEGEAV